MRESCCLWCPGNGTPLIGGVTWQGPPSLDLFVWNNNIRSFRFLSTYSVPQRSFHAPGAQGSVCIVPFPFYEKAAQGTEGRGNFPTPQCRSITVHRDRSPAALAGSQVRVLTAFSAGPEHCQGAQALMPGSFWVTSHTCQPFLCPGTHLSSQLRGGWHRWYQQHNW